MTRSTGSPSRASAANCSRVGSRAHTTASGAAAGGSTGPPDQTNGRRGSSASSASRRPAARRSEATTAKRAGALGGGERPAVRRDRGCPDEVRAAGVALEKIAELGGVPAQDDAAGVARLREQAVECGAVLARDGRLGPGENERLNGFELQSGAGNEGGEILDRAREDLRRLFLEESRGAGESGDGMQAPPRRRGRGPLGRPGGISAHNHGGRGHERPQLPRLLHGGRRHQHHAATALQRGLRFTQTRHTDLGCQRAKRTAGC